MKYIKSIRIFFLGLFLIVSHIASAQLTIHLSAIPTNTPVNSEIFIAGNFNNWDEGNDAFKLINNNDGTFDITFTPAVGTLEFKFTRGSWPTVEGGENSSFIPNRTLNYSGGQQYENLSIAGWEDGGNGSGDGSLTYNTYLLSEDFEMPQLNRTRRLWLYLPPNYETTDLTYPVMYMHDGQNLFNQLTSFSGEWEVDESLNTLFDNGDDGIIIIGIDNGGAHRIDEYTPWSHPEYGGGEGEAYVDFIVETLKPFVDANFRTKPDRLNTGIMGSSLGGLISFYAAIEHQDVFSKVGALSPSFWFSEEIYSLVENRGKEQDMKIYLLGGEQESATLIHQLESMQGTLIEAGFEADEIELDVHADGQHSEWFWRREFPNAYTWLFADVINSTADQFPMIEMIFSPNPVVDTLFFDTNFPLDQCTAMVYTTTGQLVLTKELGQANLSMQGLPDGAYFVDIIQKGKSIFTDSVVKASRNR